MIFWLISLVWSFFICVIATSLVLLVAYGILYIGIHFLMDTLEWLFE